MIRNNPMHDTVSPPGQVEWKPPKYLRDVIQRIQQEEAPLPLPDAEKRLERLKQALLSLCDEADQDYRGTDELPQVYSASIRKLLEGK